MRRAVVQPASHAGPAITRRAEGRAWISTRGQFNPVHRFPVDSAIAAELSAGKSTPTATPVVGATGLPPSLVIAKDAKEFRQMVSNPGPLRIAYSTDYLDWYYRAYQTRLKHARVKARSLSKYPWGTPRAADVAVRVAAASSGANDGANLLPSVGTPELAVVKPYTSPSRQANERRMQQALNTVEDGSITHGLIDAFERLPQFAQIHIDQASDAQIRAIGRKYFLDPAISGDMLWRKAMILRALLLEKKNTYPQSFGYIFPHAESCVFASTTPAAAAAGTVEAAKPTETPVTPLADGSVPPAPSPPSPAPAPTPYHQLPGAHTKIPAEVYAEYYRNLVKVYHVENSVDAHVLLQCHLEGNADVLLLSNPPPKEDAVDSKGKKIVLPLVAPRANTQVGGDGPDAPVNVPSLPPIEELFSNDANLSLLRCLIFADWNCAVSTDPFQKYPNAVSVVTRPTLAQVRTLSQAKGMEERLKERRGLLLASVTPPIQSVIAGRERDVLRLEQQHAKQDAMFDREIAKLVDEDPAKWGGHEGPFYNPKMVRPEIRDAVSRSVMDGVKEYNRARHQTVLETAATTAVTAGGGGGSTLSSAIFDLETNTRRRGKGVDLSPFRPTVMRYLHQVMADKHFMFIRSMLSDLAASVDPTAPSSSSVQASAKAIIDTLQASALELSMQLFKCGMEWHDMHQRKLHFQKVQIAASMFDMAIADGLKLIQSDPAFGALMMPLTTSAAPSGATATAAASQQDAATGPNTTTPQGKLQWGAIVGTYVPWAQRPLTAQGFPSEARMDDYMRWMAAAPPPGRNQPPTRMTTELPSPPRTIGALQAE